MQEAQANSTRGFLSRARHGLAAALAAALALAPAAQARAPEQRAAAEEATTPLPLAEDARPQSDESASAGPYGPPSRKGESGAAAPQAIPQSLDRAARLALDSSPLVRAARAESRALDAEVRAEKWQRFPSLNAEALAATRGSSVADADGLALNLALEQPVWSGGAIKNRIDAARARRDVGAAREDELDLQLLLGVSDAYYEAALGRGRIEVLEASLKQHRELIESIARRVERQVSPRVDLTLAQTRADQIEIALAAAREAFEIAQGRLVELTGVRLEALELPPRAAYSAIPPSEALLPEALSCSPTIGVRAKQVELAEAERRAARSQLFPQLLLQLSQNEITGSRAAVVLRAQTGAGLSKLSRVEAAEARSARAQAERAQAEREITTQVAREYSSLHQNLRRAVVAQSAADAARALVESNRRLFIAGRRSWLDVMNSVREEWDSRLTAREAEVRAAASAARLFALACRWYPQPSDEERADG